MVPLFCSGQTWSTGLTPGSVAARAIPACGLHKVARSEVSLVFGRSQCCDRFHLRLCSFRKGYEKFGLTYRSNKPARRVCGGHVQEDTDEH
uniref:Secreted protein n=1 Tax=Macrostomum lignano TaxID=282301 RepID=A0A1I8FAE7_9PLAT